MNIDNWWLATKEIRKLDNEWLQMPTLISDICEKLQPVKKSLPAQMYLNCHESFLKVLNSGSLLDHENLYHLRRGSKMGCIRCCAQSQRKKVDVIEYMEYMHKWETTRIQYLDKHFPNRKK